MGEKDGWTSFCCGPRVSQSAHSPIRERGKHIMHGSTETILNAEFFKSASICIFISVHIPATFGNNIVLFLLKIIISS